MTKIAVRIVFTLFIATLLLNSVASGQGIYLPIIAKKPDLYFNVAVTQCEPQTAATWFDGRTLVQGAPESGFTVIYSDSPDGTSIASVQTGPSNDAPNWEAGYFSFTISTAAVGPIAGTWNVWVVNEQGKRISEIASWTSDGQDGTCNQAHVTFDSR